MNDDLWMIDMLSRLPPNHALIRADDGMWRVRRFPGTGDSVCRSVKVYPTAFEALRAFYESNRKEQVT